MAKVNDWGYTNKTKWALIRLAPFTASGLNELLATTETRTLAVGIAKAVGVRKLSTRSGYQIVKLEDIKNG
jgi:hypothetical protein